MQAVRVGGFTSTMLVVAAMSLVLLALVRAADDDLKLHGADGNFPGTTRYDTSNK